MIGDVLSVGDGHQGWQTKLSIKKDLELPNCPKTGVMTFETVLDKGYSLDPVLRLLTPDSRLPTRGLLRMQRPPLSLVSCHRSLDE